MRTIILASLLLAGAAQAQTTTWNGHTYEVIQYKDVYGEDPRPSFQWWGPHNPYEHAPTLGGHVVTITSAEEEEAVRELWSRMPAPAVYYTICDVMTLDRSVEPWVVTWNTGETSTYLPENFPTDPDCYHFILDGNPMGLGVGCDQFIGDGASFYILEKDPPRGDPDSDLDGIPDRLETNTRHHYEFIQVPDPWSSSNTAAGWTFERIKADAGAHGGHVVDVNSAEEMIALNAIDPWPVGLSSFIMKRVPTLTGAIKVGLHPHEAYLTEAFSTERYSTYILEVEDSTDPHNPDTDGDGFDDGTEVDSGSDPINPQSVPEVINMQVFSAIEVEIPTTAGRKYQLQTIQNLTQGVWVPLGEVFLGTGSPHTQFIQAREQASFLRTVIVK